MDKQINVNVADLYALREFLVRHYTATDPKFQDGIRELFGGDRYLFTQVYRSKNLKFQLRKTRMLRFYDLVDFVFSNGSIQVQKKELKDETDAEKVRGLVDVLGTRCYNNIISNLNQLSE